MQKIVLKAVNLSSYRYTCLIGAQKCGTTSLYRYMQTHPELHTILWKEGKLFLDHPFKSENISRYEKLLEGHEPNQHIFETSTYYTKYPKYENVPENIRRLIPGARLIYLVRDPVQRIWSQYCHYLAKDWERKPLLEAIESNPDYLNFSRYFMQLDRYLKVFPREQLHVVIFEEFIREKERTLEQVFDFLGIDSSFIPPNLNAVYNAGGTKCAMTPSLRIIKSLPGYKKLPHRFRKWSSQTLGKNLPNKAEVFTKSVQTRLFQRIEDDIHLFFELLGRDVQEWKSTNFLLATR